MPRRVSNPPNPWSTTEVEWLEEPPPVRVEVFEERARSLLTANDSPDVPFRFSVNPYRGCQHACAYCYARPGHQHLGFGAGTDFDAKIVVKTNAEEVLRRELARGKGGSEWIAFSGVTDPYQPLEASYGLTRACLEACREFRRTVGVITKGALVRRDIDVLARIPDASVFLSIPFADEHTSRAIEPWAPAPATRFETLRALADAGIATGISISPLIPGLNDHQLPELLERAAAAGARRAFTILLRLPGEVRQVFEQRLRAAFPERADKVLNAVAEQRAPQGRAASDFGTRMQGAGPRWEIARALFEQSCRRFGLETRMDGPTEPLAPAVRARTAQGELFE